MKLLQRLRDAFRPEERAEDPSWTALKNGGLDGASTALVSPRVAENLSTVLACVGAISSSMASLPAYVYRTLPIGREEDKLHAVARMVALGANEHQSWCDFVEWVMASVLLRGNALAQIVTDGRGGVLALKPIPWEWCSVQLLASGRLVYDIDEAPSVVGAATGRRRRLLQDEVFHLRDRSDDGFIGRSRLSRAAAVVQAGLSMQEFANALYRNGVNPSGALETDQKLSHEQRISLATSFRDAFAGPTKAAKALVLDQGMKWSQISISPEDAEFLASRRFTVEELCRLFNVPPPIAGDLTHGTFANTETLVRLFATNTLTPWVRKIEAEFTRSVFSAASRSTHRLELDLSGLLRGDPAQRWQAWKIAVEANILTPDEVRQEEGWNPRGASAAA